ncbi:MAG: thioesterase family protein [Alcanivoracaceae bacterium]|jgi:acyl-CoA thioester hydrolase|nr:thioesterase family protein [Alcanivoracaceae bacterium]
MTAWDLPEPYVLTMTVPDEAIDVMGHANNCEYLRWLERIAWAHTEALGLGWDVYQTLNRGMVARHTELEYLAAAFAGDELQIGTWIVENDQRLSIVRRYQIVRVSDQATLLRGRTRWVCVALDSGRPKRMPPEFVSGYAVTADEAC